MGNKFIKISFLLACASISLSNAYAMEVPEEISRSSQLKSKDVFQIPSEKQWVENDVEYFSKAWLWSSVPLKSAVPRPKNSSIPFKDPPFVQVNPIHNATPKPQNLGDPRYVQVLTLAYFDGYIPRQLKALGYTENDHYVSIQYLPGTQDEQIITDTICRDLISQGFLKSAVENSNNEYYDIEEHIIDKNKYSILQYWAPYRSYLFVTEDVNKVAEFLSVFSNRSLIPDFLIPKMMKYAHMQEVNVKPASIPFTNANIEHRMPSKVLRIKTQDGCLHEQNPLPTKDDPYQSKSVALSQDLLNHIFYGKNEEIEFYKGGLVDLSGNPRNDQMQKRGDFIIDYKFMLGYGDKGCVFLAQHAPSKIFVAAKSVSSCENPLHYPDVLSLQKLERLYGLFKTRNDDHREETLIFMPLANGVPSTSLKNMKAFPVKATIQDHTLNINNLEVGLNLISCFIKEVEYFGKSGYFQVDAQAAHVYVCDNFQSVCIIDYDGEQRAQSIPEAEWCIAPYWSSIVNFLGIHTNGVFGSWDLLPSDKIAQLKQPQHLIDFLKAVDNNKRGSYSLAQLKLDFKTLKTACDKS